MQVPLLDLKLQYQSLKKELDEAVLKVAESQYFILGPEVTALESEICSYLNVKHAIGVSSGTDALLLSLMAIGIGPGDEVIVPTYSFFATAGVVSRLNAVPVFVDNDMVTFNISPSKIEEKITSKTKAIIPVHLYGQSADMHPIMKIANKYNLKVVEDGAQAIGVEYKDGKKVGTFGDAGCFSFFPSKNLGGYGDGGMITTNDDELAERIRIMRVHGGAPKYHHKVIGGNFRLDALQAAVLRVKLPHLDSWSEKRRKNAAVYKKYFVEFGLNSGDNTLEYSDENKVLLPEAIYENVELNNYHIFNQHIIRVQKRDELIDYLRSKNIGCEIYYPVPFHKQECFSNLNFDKNDFPNADTAAAETIALPIFPELTEEQIKYVVEMIYSFYKN